jgi:hypothetical protein
MNRRYTAIFLGSLFTVIFTPSINSQVNNPACLQIQEAQSNFDTAKRKSDAALQVYKSPGLGAGSYRAARANYDQVKKEERVALGILKTVTQKCGMKPRKQK